MLLSSPICSFFGRNYTLFEVKFRLAERSSRTNLSYTKAYPSTLPTLVMWILNLSRKLFSSSRRPSFLILS